MWLTCRIGPCLFPSISVGHSSFSLGQAVIPPSDRATWRGNPNLMGLAPALSTQIRNQDLVWGAWSMANEWPSLRPPQTALRDTRHCWDQPKGTHRAGGTQTQRQGWQDAGCHPPPTTAFQLRAAPCSLTHLQDVWDDQGGN